MDTVKILVFSDTHKKINHCIDVINSTGGVDAVIHAGDLIDDADDLAALFGDIPFYAVSGNNDFCSNAPYSRMVTLEGKKIFIAHGHDFHVRSGIDEIVTHAKKIGADIVVYGHTHNCHDVFERGIYVLNPGSMGFYPRTYGVITIDGDNIKTRIVKLD